MVEESDCIQHSYEEDCSNMTDYKLKGMRLLNVSTANEAFKDFFFPQKYLVNGPSHWLIDSFGHHQLFWYWEPEVQTAQNCWVIFSFLHKGNKTKQIM